MAGICFLSFHSPLFSLLPHLLFPIPHPSSSGVQTHLSCLYANTLTTTTAFLHTCHDSPSISGVMQSANTHACCNILYAWALLLHASLLYPIDFIHLKLFGVHHACPCLCLLSHISPSHPASCLPSSQSLLIPLYIPIPGFCLFSPLSSLCCTATLSSAMPACLSPPSSLPLSTLCGHACMCYM